MNQNECYCNVAVAEKIIKNLPGETRIRMLSSVLEKIKDMSFLHNITEDSIGEMVLLEAHQKWLEHAGHPIIVRFPAMDDFPAVENRAMLLKRGEGSTSLVRWLTGEQEDVLNEYIREVK